MQSLFLFVVGRLICVIISRNRNSTPVSTDRFIFATTYRIEENGLAVIQQHFDPVGRDRLLA